MIRRALFKLLHRICNWALNAKSEEDAPRIGIYHIQEWE